MTRAEFDQLMLDNAREHGVDVREGIRVLDVLFEDGRAVGVRAIDEAGVAQEIRCTVVVDAAGQGCLIQDRLGLREWDPVLKKAAIWTYWKGAKRDAGRDEGATLVMQTKGKIGWFWFIPLQDDIVSVGVVAPFDYLFKGRDSKELEAIYFEEVERCLGVQPRIEHAGRVARSVPPRNIPIAPGRWPGMAGCSWAMPSASSTRSTPRAFCWR